jgi:hypothetical protein
MAGAGGAGSGDLANLVKVGYTDGQALGEWNNVGSFSARLGVGLQPQQPQQQ